MTRLLLRRAAWLLLAVALPAAATTQAASEAVADADALLADGKLEAAGERLSGALEEDPDSALLHLRLGGVQLLRQHHSDAVESFQTAIGLGAEGAPAFIGLGIAYLHMGRYGSATAALEEAARLDPGKRSDIEALLSSLDSRLPAPSD
ncbi:MAG: tetratricopeptide repeat protein [Chromatiales bacterium]|jgi:tetratricopeptide (TPR) repeat protein